MLNFNKIDFEDFDKPQVANWIDFEGTGEIVIPEEPKKAKAETGIVKDFIVPTAKAIPRVVGAAAGSLALLPGAGIRAAIELLPKISHDPDKFLEVGSLSKAGEIFEQIMSVPGKLIKTEEEAKAVENIGYVMKPIEMSGEGWRLIGEAANKGLKKLGLDDTYIEPLFATYGEAAAIFAIPGVIKRIRNSTTFRKMTIPERGLIIQSLADTVKNNPNMTEGQILRKYNNPSWRTEALRARALKAEKPITEARLVPPIVTEPPEPTVKPTTELGRKLQAAIKAEKKPPVLADLAKRELEIQEDKIDFEAPVVPVKKDLIVEVTQQRQLEIERAEIDFEKPVKEVALEKTVEELPTGRSLWPANRVEGKLYIGKPGDLHAEIGIRSGHLPKRSIDDFDIEKRNSNIEAGWIDKDGNFLTTDEADAYIKNGKSVEKPVKEVAPEKAEAVKEPWFHGSTTGKLEYGKAAPGNQLPFGVHFTQDRDIASDFATGATKGKPTGEKGKIIKVESMPKNPLDVSLSGIYEEGSKEFKVLNEIANKSGYTQHIRDYDPEIGNFVSKKTPTSVRAINPDEVFSNAELSAIKTVLKENGYDQAIKYAMKSTRDPLGMGAPVYTKAITVLDEKLLDLAPAKPQPTPIPTEAKPQLAGSTIKGEPIPKPAPKVEEAKVEVPKKAEPKKTEKKELAALDKISRQETSQFKQDRLFEPNQQDLFGKVKPAEKPEARQKSDTTEFFSGLPIHKFPKAAKALANLYDKHIGLPLWNYLSETLPEMAGDRFALIDRINKGIIYDYKKDPAFIEVRDDTTFKIQQAKEAAKELATAMAKFSSAEQVRISQIIKGGVTATPKRYETAFEAIKKFQELEKELQSLGILGKDNRFRQLTRKEISSKFKEIDIVNKKIETLRAKLKPIIKTSNMVRKVSEDVSEEIISTITDTTTGTFETKITRATQINEGRVKQALLDRGFAEGEATQMIARIKDSVIPLEGKKGTLKEIRETIKSVVTKTIIQEVEKLKTYSPSMMARARGSIVKDINKEINKRNEILNRIRLHYKMSGKLYLRRAYEKIESERGFLSKLMGYASKRPRLIKGYNIRRQDLSYLYRKGLGEIKKAPHLVYKGLSEESHDALMMEMFNNVLANKDWTISPEKLAVINSGTNEKLILKYKDFKPLPVTERLGKLSGQLVDPYIWDDLNQAVVQVNDMIKAWDSVLRLWKTGKVVYNPATQCRNMLSNIILADFGGLPPHRIDIYARAAKELLTKGQYWQEAKQTPLLGTEWAATEIKQFLTETSGLKEGNFLSELSKTTRSLLDKPGQLYQGTEQFFKLAVFINERKNGRTIKEAGAHAEKTIFNYQKIPPAIRWAKRYYSPFITFSFKAIPRFAETAIRKPWKIAKYGIMMLAVEEITRRMYGESKEEVEQEKKVLPDYMRKAVLPGQLSHMRIPYKDKYNRSKYLDLSFILPWGDVAEQWGQSRLVGRPFLPSHPLYIAVAEIAFNEVLFTSQELTTKDVDTGSDYLKKIGVQLWRQAVPSLAGSYSYNKLMAAYKGEVDWALRDRSLPEAMFDVFLGLKIRSIDYTEERGRRLKYLRGRINVIKERFEKDYSKIVFNNPTPDLENDQQRTAKLYLKMNEQIDKILEKITEIEE